MFVLSVLDFDDILDQSVYPSEDKIIAGRIVYAENGTPASDVSVTIKQLDENMTTNETGEFFFSEVNAGEYTIIINKSGYKTIEKEIYIRLRDEKENYDFELEEGEGEILEEAKDTSSAWANSLFGICGVLILVFSIIAIFGAIAALKRTNYWLALLGSLFGILSIGLGLGLILSIVALILLLLSKNSFR
jgi:hypothetical protein